MLNIEHNDKKVIQKGLKIAFSVCSVFKFLAFEFYVYGFLVFKLDVESKLAYQFSLKRN